MIALLADSASYYVKKNCPGFGQDRVNFHQYPGRDTALRADPTWPNRTGYSMPRAVMLGSGWGRAGPREGTPGLARGCSAAAGGESSAFYCYASCILLICIVVVPVPFVCCSVKLPLCRPTSFCLFLSILLRTSVGRGAAAWRFCCQPQLNYHKNVFFLKK